MMILLCTDGGCIREELADRGMMLEKNKQKIALVTGACGFIGSHLVEELVREGYYVRAMVQYTSANSIGWLSDLDKSILEKITIYHGDIRSCDSLLSMMKGVHIVFHLAALISVPYSYATPQSYVDTNVHGALNILNLCKQLDIERVIMTSSSEVYGSACYVPIDEVHPLQAQSPYAASKIASDKLAESYYLSYQMPVSVVRPFNTYGPRQSPRAFISCVMSQALSDSSFIELGNLLPRRDFTYVTDVCRAFVSIAQCRDAIGEVLNICSGQSTSMGDLAQKILNLMGVMKKVHFDSIRVRPAKSEVRHLEGSFDKLKQFVPWHPHVTLDEGLLKTIKWHETQGRFAYDRTDHYYV